MALLLLAAHAQAAPQWCSGTVSNLYIDADGMATVLPSWRADYVRLCNVTQAYGSISPTTCIAWVALLRSAVQRNSATTIHYAEAPACASMPVYAAAPAPTYVMMMN